MLLTSRATRACRSLGAKSTVAADEGARAVPSSNAAIATTTAAVVTASEIAAFVRKPR